MSQADFVPYIPAERTVPEVTIKALLLGIGLGLIMTAANTYLGLYAGMTVSASIPAAVISMGILRGAFSKATILENNIVQTIASAGESLAAGIIFTIPAMVITGVWTEFKFWPTTLIAIFGGLLGVLFMIPLRRALIVEEAELIFPEGVACAEVLEAGDRGGVSVSYIFQAMAVGAIFKFLVSGWNMVAGTLEGAWVWMIGKLQVSLYMGTDVSVALLSVGYIVGFNISLLVFIGGALGWLAAIPIFIARYALAFDPSTAGTAQAALAMAQAMLTQSSMGVAEMTHATKELSLSSMLISASSGGEYSSLDMMWTIWDTRIRFLGVGAMVVGGIWSIIKVRKGIVRGIGGAMAGYSKATHADGSSAVSRTERDLSLPTILGFLLATIIPIFVLYIVLTKSFGIGVISGLLMVVTAFFFVAVASYIVGLVGSSNSPVSGMTICTVLLSSAVLWKMGMTGTAGIIASLGIAGVVCCAACTSGDICQDLKTGYLVGATPWKQQAVQLVAVITPAAIIPPILTLLHTYPGIGIEVIEGVQPLKAPQATLFASLVSSIFTETPLPWGMLISGSIIGVVIIAIDEILRSSGKVFRMHIMPVAVGIYLPLSLSVPILFGGLIALVLTRRAKGKGDDPKHSIHRGTLFASGLIAGEAIMGILLASMVFFKLDPKGLMPIIMLGVVVWMLVKVALSRTEEG
ncbi:MAG: oligopeptide transporter, OPT family [Candidatus Alcyoniella australis]|nr:oligopeptide transporter, OPT family [Candidatus Alcyoniella australis]